MTICVAAGLGLAAVVHEGWSLRGAVAGFFVGVLVVLAAIDLAWRIVPNPVVISATVLVLAGNVAAQPSPSWALAGVLLFLAFLVAHLVSPAGIGMGDVKLAALAGVGCGGRTVTALLVAAVAVVAFALVVFARSGFAAGRKQTFPFVPFLALGAIVATFV